MSLRIVVSFLLDLRREVLFAILLMDSSIMCLNGSTKTAGLILTSCLNHAPSSLGRQWHSKRWSIRRVSLLDNRQILIEKGICWGRILIFDESHRTKFFLRGVILYWGFNVLNLLGTLEGMDTKAEVFHLVSLLNRVIVDKKAILKLMKDWLLKLCLFNFDVLHLLLVLADFFLNFNHLFKCLLF